MISIENIEQLLKEGECKHIRIYDRTMTNHILDIDGETPELTYEKFKTNSELLSGYGVLTLKAGNDTIHKRSMQGASVWKVFFPAAASGSPVIASQTPVNTGYQKEFLELSIAIATMKLERDFEKKERELEKKYEKDEDGVDKYMKYLPLFGTALGMSDETMLKKLQMCQMAGGLGGTGQGIQSTGNKLTVSGTEEEKQNIVQTLVPEIYNKVDKDKFISVLQQLNQNPEFLESAYAYMSLTNTSGLAGNNPASEGSKIVFDYNLYAGNLSSHNDENF